MPRKTTLQRIQDAVKPGQGWLVTEMAETFHDGAVQAHMIYLLDPEAVAQEVESFQAALAAEAEGGKLTRNHYWRAARNFGDRAIGLAIRFTPKGAIVGANYARLDYTTEYRKPTPAEAAVYEVDEDGEISVPEFSVKNTTGWWSPDTKKVTEIERAIENLSPAARRAQERADAERRAEQEAKQHAAQVEREFIAKTETGREVILSLLARHAEAQHDALAELQSLARDVEKLIARVEAGETLWKHARIHPQTISDAQTRLAEYILIQDIVARHPLGDLRETPLTEKEQELLRWKRY